MPDAHLDEIAALGFDWFYLLGAWQTGPASREVSRTHEGLIRSHSEHLPDFTDADVCGSPFAIAEYRLHRDFGEDAALDRFRRRLHARGMKLMLDFVPNHVGLDHPFVLEHPEWLIEGTEADLARAPEDWMRIGGRIFAHGRDPHFPGWADTLQLDFRKPALQAEMMGTFAAIARRCDGLRCDMAMLLLPDVFRRTWGGDDPPDFWAAAIPKVRADTNPTLMAEVYWDLEWTLQEKGFDLTYDKRLYDRLRDGTAESIRLHLAAEPAFAARCVRFLENHDEKRAAAIFSAPKHRAAAVLAFFAPGLAFFHDGQLEGRTARASVHLARRREEAPDGAIAMFYRRLLGMKRHRTGDYRVYSASHPQLIAFRRGELYGVVNYGAEPAVGRVELEPFTVELDLFPWEHRLFVITIA